MKPTEGSVYNFNNWNAVAVSAASPVDCDVRPFELGQLDPKDIIECGLDPTKYKSGSMSPYEIIQFITTQIAFIAYLLCIIGFLVGAINLITSAGDKTKAQNGKTIMTNSIIGLVIVVLVQNILLIVLNIFGFNYSITP